MATFYTQLNAFMGWPLPNVPRKWYEAFVAVCKEIEKDIEEYEAFREDDEDAIDWLRSVFYHHEDVDNKIVLWVNLVYCTSRIC